MPPAMIVLLAMVTALGGCTTVNKEIDVPPPGRVSVLKTDGMHCYDVLDKLGPPAQITALPEGSAWFYHALVIKERQIGITLPGDIGGLIKLAMAGADVTEQIQVFVFDTSGHLRSHGDLDATDDVGSGLAFQFFATVGQVVDTRYLEETPVQQDWGRGLLKPLPQTLNAGQSLGSGDRGAELRGTPKKVGQRTLEMQ
jgi:hypothetical protein